MSASLGSESVSTGSASSSSFGRRRTIKDDEKELEIFLRHENWNVAAVAERKIEAVRQIRSELSVESTCRGKCFQITQYCWFAWLFNGITVLALVLALVQINISLSIQEAKGNPNYPAVANILEVLSLVITFIFTVEIAIRIVGSYVPFLQDGWLVTDTIVTLISAIGDFFSILSGGGVVSLAFVRAIKILRIFRVIKVFTVCGRNPSIGIISGVMVENMIQALWLFVVLGVMSWCVAIAMTIVGGAGLSETLDSFEVVVGDQFFAVRPLLGNVFGSLLFVTMIPWRALRWGPSFLRPLLAAESTSFNMLGICSLIYIMICIIALVPVTVAVFMSGMSAASSKDSERRIAQQRYEHQLKISDLCRIFKKGIGSSDESSMSMRQFKQAMRDNEPLARALLIESGQPDKDAKHVEALFHELDRGSEVGVPLSHLTMSEFVLGIVKLTRLNLRPEFMRMDEHQLQVMQMGKRVLDSYQSLMLTLFRYSRSLAASIKHLDSCVGSMHDRTNKAKTSPKKLVHDRREKVPWLTDRKFGQQLSSLRARLDKMEENLEELKVPQVVKAETQHAIVNLMESILEKDVLPWLHENIQRKVLPAQSSRQPIQSSQPLPMESHSALQGKGSQPLPKSSALPPPVQSPSTQQGLPNSILGKQRLTSQNQIASTRIHEKKRTVAPDAVFASSFVPVSTTISRL